MEAGRPLLRLMNIHIRNGAETGEETENSKDVQKGKIARIQ